MKKKNYWTTKGKRLSILLIISVFSLLSYHNTSAQITMNGDLSGHVEKILDSMPGKGSCDYAQPTSAQFVQWQKLIDTLYQKNYATAHAMALSMNYRLIEFTAQNETYYILQKQDTTGNYWGTYVFNPDACRDVVIQSPHPKFEYNTGKQGLYLLEHTQSRFFCLAGTHRCNDTLYTRCSGLTTVCSNNPESYRLSDVAHNDSCIFQATTRALINADTNLTFIQLHGFAKKSTDPFVIMSNGTRTKPKPDYVDSLKRSLEKVDTILSFKVGHQDLSWSRLLGFTNVQGRFLNASNDPCFADADTSFGRFVHIEQEYQRLRKNDSMWNKMAVAVSQSFACKTSANISESKELQTLRLYPNPCVSEVMLEIDNFNGKKSALRIYDSYGRVVGNWNYQALENGKIKIFTHHLKSGMYIIELCTSTGAVAREKLMVK